jgi:phospholipase/carboxylesterase
MDEARAALAGMLHEAARTLGVDPARTVIGGFSQGSMLATDLALGTDRALAGLVILSGTILDELAWTEGLAGRRGLPVFQSHGTEDPLLPFEIAERWTTAMKDAGLLVDAVTFRGGHEIPRPVLAGLDAFLARNLV